MAGPSRPSPGRPLAEPVDDDLRDALANLGEALGLERSRMASRLAMRVVIAARLWPDRFVGPSFTGAHGSTAGSLKQAAAYYDAPYSTVKHLSTRFSSFVTEVNGDGLPEWTTMQDPMMVLAGAAGAVANATTPDVPSVRVSCHATGDPSSPVKLNLVVPSMMTITSDVVTHDVASLIAHCRESRVTPGEVDALITLLCDECGELHCVCHSGVWNDGLTPIDSFLTEPFGA